MTVTHNSRNETLLVALQRGVPLEARPFATIGRTLDLSEEDVLLAVRKLFETGVARRFGAVFDSRRLGYGSTLCAVDVPPDDLARVAAVLAPHSGVTHCYEREGNPNLWFTLTARADRLQSELRAFASAVAPYPLLDLPALRRFKVQVVLDARPDPLETDAESMRDRDDRDTGFSPLSESEKSVVRKLQGNLPVTEAPFADLAHELDREETALLDLLKTWKLRGVLRRIGIILRHRKAGFVANGMCVWRVDSGDIERAGRALAAAHEVTHCYERPSFPGFPFNLFAMIHARQREVAHSTFRRLSQEVGLHEGRILMSVREFKKSSPVFFCEDAGSREEAAT